MVARRAAKLRIGDLHRGVTDKLAVVQALAAKHRIAREAVCYVGDGVGDLGAMRRVGFAVSDALPPIRRLPPRRGRY